jgi:hypothetical protein
MAVALKWCVNMWWKLTWLSKHCLWIDIQTLYNAGLAHQQCEANCLKPKNCTMETRWVTLARNSFFLKVDISFYFAQTTLRYIAGFQLWKCGA